MVGSKPGYSSARPITMLLNVIATLFLTQTANWPENPSVDYSGIPQISGGNLTIVSHNTAVDIYERYATVSSTTLVKNNGGIGMAAISIPRYRMGDEASGVANFDVKASWVGKPLSLKAASSNRTGSGKLSIGTTWLKGQGALKAGGSYALKVSYLVPLGKSGFDRKQNLVAYDLTSPAQVGVLMCSFKYANGVVFRLPETRPEVGWQVGARGVFKRWESYGGDAGVATLAYYPGGFKNIGGGN